MSQGWIVLCVAIMGAVLILAELYVDFFMGDQGLARRADEQNALAQAGDLRGVYGDYPPVTDLFNQIDSVLQVVEV